MINLDHARTYSYKVFEVAEADPSVAPDRYADLSELVRILGLDGSDPVDPDGVRDLLASGVTPNLIVLDDEPTLSELLRGRLVEWGYPPEYIHTFTLSSEALHFASNNPIGIAFLDIKLDGGGFVQDAMYTSGMEVLKEIKRGSPEAKAVLISGFGTYEMARRGILDLGASFYLSKPFRLGDVVRIVSWALGKATTPTRRDDRPTNDGGSEHILIVDDDVVLSESVSLGLEAFGYRTTRVTGGEAALEAVRKTRFDAVLLDLMMPGMSGVDVLRWLQRERRYVDVFVFSAVSDDLTARQVVDLGAKGYFLKPCDISLVTRTLEFHFAKRLGAV